MQRTVIGNTYQQQIYWGYPGVDLEIVGLFSKTEHWIA